MPTTITPDIFSNTPSYFNSGGTYATGVYIVTYTQGAMKYNAGTNWFCNNYRIIDALSNVTLGPCYGVVTGYANQAACEAANAGTFVTYNQTVTGKIGLFFTDSVYGDNVAGSPNPTFQLEPFVLSASMGCQAANALSWSAIAAATSYTLYRSTTSGSGYVQIYSGAALTYTDALTVGGTYYYVVTVTTPNGTSGYSNEVHVDAQISTPNVLTGATLSFYPGSNLSAGRYRVSYLVGAYKLNPNRPWGVGFNDNDVQIDGAHGYYVTDGAGNVAHGPGNTLGYTSQSAAETGNAGEYVYYDHLGGNPIGMYLLDGYYPDNVAGSPSPTFSLCGPLVATLTASVLSIDVGDSATLTWASTNADSATDPVGGTTTSGSQAVSPTVLTVYSFDVVGFSGNIELTRTVTVVVNQPTPPTFTEAVGVCGGLINLRWSGASHTASYVIEQSTNGVSGWTAIQAQSGTTYTVSPLVPGATYYYRVKSVSGSATSDPSSVFSASTILAAPTPTFTLTAKGTRIIIGWTVPSGSYGTLTVNIYRGSASGGETLLVSGLAVADGSYTNSHLMAGSTYYYRVSFTNACGEGTLAAEQSVTPVCCQGDYTASPMPTNTFTPSVAPSPSATASTAPTPGGWTPSDCPG